MRTNTNITLKDMATMLGVSVSTVSKALSGSSEISNSTKEKVLRIADSLKYRPNFYASALRNNRSFILGIILPDLKDDFFLDSLNGITEESSKHNYKVMVYQSCNDYRKEVVYANLLSESNIIDGLIFSSTKKTFVSNNDEHIDAFSKKGLPITYLNKKNSSHSLISAKENGYLEGKNSVRNLLQKIEALDLAKGA